ADDRLVRRAVLARHVPCLARASDTDALALADGVERKADVLADRAAFGIDDRTGHFGQIAVQELPEGTLADEADAGRVLLCVVRQPRLEGDAAHLGLINFAYREHHARKLFLRQPMQEVAL